MDCRGEVLDVNVIVHMQKTAAFLEFSNMYSLFHINCYGFDAIGYHLS